MAWRWPWSKKADAAPQNAVVSSSDRAGMVVNERTAMLCSAVFGCVRLISGAISSAPVLVYRRGQDGRRVVAGRHPLAQVLNLRPNRFMTGATFWKSLLADKLLHGNGYAHIVRDGVGNVVALYPMKARNVVPYLAWELGLDRKLGVERNRLFYDAVFDDGARRVFDQMDVIHVPNVGFDGRRGLSTIQAAANGIGLAISAETSASKFFANGTVTNLKIEYPAGQKLNPEALERLRDHFQDRHASAENHHKPLILTDGGSAGTLNMSNTDAQLLESRQFSVIDICRFFGVPPVMIGETEKTTSWGSGVEQMGRWFVMFTLNDHLTAIEQELEVKLFGDGHFAEFDETEMTRGNTKTLAEAYRVARGSMQEPGYMTINEIRQAEGLEPVEGGDVLQRPQEVTLAPQ